MNNLLRDKELHLSNEMELCFIFLHGSSMLAVKAKSYGVHK